MDSRGSAFPAREPQLCLSAVDLKKENRTLLYPKGAGDRISRRLSYSLVDGFVGHLRIEIQIDFLKLNVYYIYI